MQDVKQAQSGVTSACSPGPEATCLLDTGGLGLHCCRDIPCLFPARAQGSLNVNILSGGVRAWLHFQSKPPGETMKQQQ